MILAGLISELKQAYETAGLDCGKELYPPVSPEEIAQLEADLKMTLPAEMRELLLIHGGQEYLNAGTRGLFGRHKLLTPCEIVEWYDMTLEVYGWHRADPPDEFPPKQGVGGWWNPKLIPFASWDAYGLCIHAERGDVWDFEPYSGLISHLPSIAATLRHLIDTLKETNEIDLPSRL